MGGKDLDILPQNHVLQQGRHCVVFQRLVRLLLDRHVLQDGIWQLCMSAVAMTTSFLFLCLLSLTQWKYLFFEPNITNTVSSN